MTDRIHALTVTLDDDYRDDDVQPLADAIRRLRGVANVSMHVTRLENHTAMVRARLELQSKIADIIWPKAGAK